MPTSGRGAIIISKHYEKIAKQIMIELDRGITILDGEGFFTQEKKKVLYCVVGKTQINQVKKIALTIDPYAFVSITHVHEVIGEGFTLDERKIIVEIFYHFKKLPKWQHHLCLLINHHSLQHTLR